MQWVVRLDRRQGAPEEPETARIPESVAPYSAWISTPSSRPSEPMFFGLFFYTCRPSQEGGGGASAALATLLDTHSLIKTPVASPEQPPWSSSQLVPLLPRRCCPWPLSHPPKKSLLEWDKVATINQIIISSPATHNHHHHSSWERPHSLGSHLILHAALAVSLA